MGIEKLTPFVAGQAAPADPASVFLDMHQHLRLLRCRGKTKTVARRISIIIVLFVIFAQPAGAARCLAKSNCSKDVPCSTCSSAESRELCAQITFCEWLPSCRAASTCPWVQGSACVAKEQSAWGDVCKHADSSAACAEKDSCVWKEDCRQCTNLTSRGECVLRDWCEWAAAMQTFGQALNPESPYPITAVDIGFVVAMLLCELYTAVCLMNHIFTCSFNRGSDGNCTVCGMPEEHASTARRNGTTT